MSEERKMTEVEMLKKQIADLQEEVNSLRYKLARATEENAALRSSRPSRDPLKEQRWVK